MNTKESYYAAEDVSTEILNMKAMLSAVDDKVRFHLLEPDVYGPYAEIVRYHAGEIQSLLAIVEDMLSNAETGISGVVHTLHELSREADCA